MATLTIPLSYSPSGTVSPLGTLFMMPAEYLAQIRNAVGLVAQGLPNSTLPPLVPTIPYQLPAKIFPAANLTTAYADWQMTERSPSFLSLSSGTVITGLT